MLNHLLKVWKFLTADCADVYGFFMKKADEPHDYLIGLNRFAKQELKDDVGLKMGGDTDAWCHESATGCGGSFEVTNHINS